VALASLGVLPAEAVMVGHRIETDVAMGQGAGRTILVLSGVTRADDPRIAGRPADHVIGSVEDLMER
jgi:ribonucleotide monophosphatase NagD (HAD superfamily)